MKRLLWSLLILLCLSIAAKAQYVKVLGAAEQSQPVVTSGISSTTKAQRTFPSATITIYNSGTTNLASIFTNSTGTVKANPFTADSFALYDFFIAAGSVFDVRISGTGVTTPFTRSGYTAPGSGSSGTLIVCAGTNDTAAFSAAISAFGSNPGAVQLPNLLGSRCAVNTLTIPANVSLNNDGGSGIKVNTGQTLTLAGPVVNPAGKQFFYNATAGLGTVTIGGTAISELYPQWWGAFPTNSAANNNAPLQAAITGAGAGRTNGNGASNRTLVFTGNFSISAAMNGSNMTGFQWKGITKLYSGITQTAANTKLLDANHISYGTFHNLSFSTPVAQSATLLDLYSTDGSDLSPQNITFYDCSFHGDFSDTKRGVWIARPGGGSQGDNVRFYNCNFNGFSEAAIQLGGGPSTDYAYNAIYIQVIGGDFQGNPKYGLAAYGGSFIVKNATFENGNFVYPTGAAQTGWDLFSEGSQNINIAEDIRSESLRFATGAWHIRNCSILGPVSTFVTPWTGIPNTNSFTNQLVTGTPYGGDGKMYAVTSTTVFSPFLAVTPGAVAGPTFSSPNWTMTITVAGPLVPGAMVGQTLVLRYPNCFDVYSTVTANDATTISLTSLSQLYTPGDATGQSCSPHTNYAIVISLPMFGGLQDTTATGGSATTIVKAAAGWTVNQWIDTPMRATIMSGTGKRQHCDITGNTADTITCAAGWVNDYPEVGGVVPAIQLIVDPDNTSHFVIEPIWNSGTIASGTVSMTVVNKSILGDPDNNLAMGGSIDGLYIYADGKVFVDSAIQIKNLTTRRTDWYSSNTNSLDETYPLLQLENILVVRLGGSSGEYLPWIIPRNSYSGTFRDYSQSQRGREWSIWSQGEPGGGVGFVDVGIGRGDGISNGSGDAVTRNILGYLGMLGRKTPAGTNQSGTATQIQGGLATGSGTAGKLEFWTGPTAGASGTTVRTGSRIGYFDFNGLTLDSGSFLGALNGTVGATTPAAVTGTTIIGSTALRITNAGKLVTSPTTADAWGAAISLNVGISAHDITGVFGTSATATITPTAAGSAGDWVFINTINGAGGSVVVTFAATFHSSGTQTTSASKFSSIAFRSDGTRWIEQYRTTDLN